MDKINIDADRKVQNAAENILVTPSANTWDRLSAKLELEKAHGKVRRFKLLSIASAAAVVFILVSAILVNKERLWRDHHNYVDSIHPIATVSENSQESIYSVSSVRQVNASLKQHFN